MIALLEGLSWRRFTWSQGLFSLKTFTAAMLALYIAFRLDLPQPSWSVTTVYIVSQPLAGMVLAKSFYRVLGTMIGAAMSLLLVALLSNAPELFCLALALWIGLGTAVSAYLRDAPKAYVGMLSGYSAAIIGLPAALMPETAFSLAVARCLEILLGIACATLIHHVVLPQRAGRSLIHQLTATLPSMARWVDDTLRNRGGEAARLADRRRIIAATIGLDQLRFFASLDTPALRAVDGLIRQFEGKLLSLLALLLSVHDRMALLRQTDPARAQALAPLLRSAADHIVATAELATPAAADQEADTEMKVRADIAAHLPRPHELRGQPELLLVRNILLRLGEILDSWRDAMLIRSHIAAGTAPPRAAPAPAFQPYRDPALALTAGAIAALTIGLASLFWIYSGWPNGPTAVTFAGIICAIMGARDNPAAGAAMFLRMTLVGALIAGLYLFIVLPALDSFAALGLALAPFYLVCGLLLSQPRTAPMVMPVIFGAGGLISISNQMSYDFAAYINGALGYLVGIAMGVMGLALLRPFGRDVAAARQIRGMLRDLARLAEAPVSALRSVFESRMFDRINALLAQTDSGMPADRRSIQGGLATLRIGLNLLLLKRERPRLPPGAMTAVDRAQAALAVALRSAASGRKWIAPQPHFETARHLVLAEDDLWLVADALYGIETTLQQHAAFFFPERPAGAHAPTEAVA
jgi:uncharacterized membrane protein YccC